MPKKNPIMPRNAIKAMNRGWTGFPTWAISPTISAHELMGNPPRPIPEFGYHFTSANNLESIRENGLRAPVYLFYPDSNYHAWVLSGQIDGVFEGDNPDMMAAGVTEKMFNLIMLRVRFDKSEFLPAPYETGDVHDEFYLNSDVSPDDIAIEGTFAETVGHDLMTGAYTPKNIGEVPNMQAIVEGYFTGDPDHLRPNPPGVPKEASELSIERKKEIRKKWKELVNMTATELQTFYDSDLGNKKAGLSREEAQEAGISSGRDSALAIIKMKQTPVKEWHKRHSKDRGRGIMLDFWQWAQKQINFNTRHRGMRGPYLDEKGRPTRKLLGLWIWGHDPWRYALKVKKERLPMCPNVPWVGSKEKKAYGVLPKENPVFKVILGDIVTISGPSSSGKSTIAKALSKKLRARMVPSYMTREPRPSEEQGVDGIFVSAERFEDMIAAGNFTTKEGVNLWVRQKNGEYYGRKATDFMGSQPAIVDVNFEGLRLMRKAFPDRIYSVFIRTNMGPKRRRENLEKRGVHTEEEIESRVRAGTGMLETFQNLNFDFIARNKFGELNKNVAMIASEFNKWGGAKSGIRAEARKKKQKGSDKICPHPAKLKFKSREAAFRKLKEMHPDWEYTGMSVYPCGNHWHYGHNYKTNPIQTLKKGTELLHKPTGMKYTFIEPRIDDDGTWYILKDTDSGLSNVRFEDLEQFYSLYPQSPMYIANPANQDQEEIVRRFIQSLDPSIEFDAKALELRLGNAGYKRYPNSRQIGRMLKKIHGDGLIVKTSFSGASSYRNSERNFALNNPPLGLRAIIEASIGKKGLLGVIEQANSKVKRPIRPKLPPNMMGKKSEAFDFEVAMRRYKNKLRRYKHGMKKINKYYGYSGTSGKSLVSKVIDAIEEEFKGKPTLTAYRGIFAFKSDEASIVKWITTFGAGDYYSTWKRGADIYFGEFAKQQNWADVPGAVAWFITSEISILDINWARTLRNRIYYPEEKELSILDSKSRPRRPIIIKRVDVYDLNQSAKYAKSDSTGVKHQPWLSNKIQPIASHEFYLKANPPVFDGEGAMDMGFQHEGKTRYHGHPLPGGTEIPDISGKWKKKSFPSGSEMPLRSKQEADGNYTMGFLERFEGDDRPYIVSNKIDGDSSIAHFDGKETVLWNKRGRWRKDFHLTEQITASLQENGVSSAIILGELYAVDEKGGILPLKDQKGVTIAPKDINTQQRMRFAAYDMAQINGKDVQDEPYASRMEILKPLIRGSAVNVVQSWRSRGGMEDILVAWNEVSKNPHFEGLVVRFDGDKKSYKVKMTGTADLAVIGFYRGKADGRDENIIGGGTLAWMDEDGNYVVAGNSVIGESIVEKDELLKRLLPTAIDAPKVKWGDHMVDRSVTHDHRGKGTITAIEPFLIGEFKYRSINYSEKPVYRLENDRFVQVGTKRAPTLFQASFGRWRPDKELTPHDLRMGQVAAEGQGKWKKNPVIDSGIPGVRMAYMDKPGDFGSKHNWDYQIIEASKHKRGLIGETPVTSTSKYHYDNETRKTDFTRVRDIAKVVRMSPNDYFDLLTAGGFKIPDRNARVRWADVGLEHVMSIVDGLKKGQVMVMPTISHDGRRQEGGHRMEALRQMGHADTPVPVMYLHGEDLPLRDANIYEELFIGEGGRLSETDFFSNPPDDTDYPGGTAQYMMDGLLLGSLKERMGDWRTGGNSNLVTRKNWALKYPELAARLEEAQKRGWSYTGPPLPKMKENPTQDELHQKTLDETGFWGAQGAGAIVMARSTGRFLLPLRSRHVEQPGTWGVWGGAIDANEVPATAAKREIVEEAGYEGEIEIVPLVVFESGSFRYHNHLAIVEEEFTPQLNWETERAEWFEFEDFPQPLHFGLLYMLENSTHLIDDKYWLANPMAPGYQSYGWTTQDWRSIKVNNKGEIDYSEKCGAEGTQTASGNPRLCLPAIVVKSLIRTESGKEVIRKQARKKARAKKGERIPWHPRIKKLWKKLEEKTVEDRPKKNGVLPVKHGGRFATPSFVHDDPNKKEEELHNSRKQSRDDYDESVKAYMRKNLNRLWKWDTNFKEGADGVKEKAMLKKAKAHAKKEVGAPKSCNSDCLYCAREQWKKNPSPLMRIPKIVLEDKITPAMLDSKSQIFLFGDNEQRKGKGGQAKVMRGHAKAYGIRTKRAPSMSESAFWTDKTYKSNIKMMADDFLAAFMAASDGDHELVIPSAGIGTGMAQLKQRAPRTYKWLNSFLRNLIAGEDPALLKQWRMN